MSLRRLSRMPMFLSRIHGFRWVRKLTPRSASGTLLAFKFLTILLSEEELRLIGSSCTACLDTLRRLPMRYSTALDLWFSPKPRTAFGLLFVSIHANHLEDISLISFSR